MDILYVGGSDLVRSPNHRARHFINFLQQHAARVDVVALKPLYDGAHDASVVDKVRRGVRDYAEDPASVVETGAGTELTVRKLPNRFDPYAQDLWAYLHLGPLKRRRYDVGIFGNPDNALLAWLLRKRGIVDKLVYDDWDYFEGFNRPRHWRRAITWREHLAVSMADVVISVGTLLADLRDEQGARETFVVPNGVNYPLFARAQEKKPHPPTLVYTGSIEDWAGLDVTIEGFAQVRQAIPDARYWIIGPDDNAYTRSLRDMVERLDLGDSVQFLGFKPYTQLPEFLAEADIGVALFQPTDQMKYAFHLKIVEYMAAGLAVIGTRIGETELILDESGAGQAIECTPAAFARTATEFLSDPALLKTYGEKGKAFARQYDWNQVFDSVHEIIGLERRGRDRAQEQDRPEARALRQEVVA
jgi:glycosyltransferase involved in cell wall biosynthesis